MEKQLKEAWSRECLTDVDDYTMMPDILAHPIRGDAKLDTTTMTTKKMGGVPMRVFPLVTLWAEHVETYLWPQAIEENVGAEGGGPMDLVSLGKVMPLTALKGVSVDGLMTIDEMKVNAANAKIRSILGGGGGAETVWEKQVFLGPAELTEVARDQLNNLMLYKYISPLNVREAVMNTLQYMFFHVRNGIYVKIRAGKAAIFAPFHNLEPQFRNCWTEVMSPHPFSIRGSSPTPKVIEAYYADKKKMWGALYNDEGFLNDVSKWWANAYIVDNVPQADGWSDKNNYEIKSMIDAVCATYHVPDCEFFVNKRDFPHLRYDKGKMKLLEPYSFLYGADEVNLCPIRGCAYDERSVYAPILSFASDPEKFADIMIPTVDDWKAACGASGGIGPIVPWEDRKAKAVWRGSTTGLGVTKKTNQRLALVALARDQEDILDCRFTSLCLRDRVDPETAKMDFIAISEFEGVNVKRAELAKNRLTYHQQQAYKFQIYVQGHSAAYRLGQMLFSGACILFVESTCAAHSLFFSRALGKGFRPLEEDTEAADAANFISVKSDLSDLVPTMRWAVDHDAICAKIAMNAYNFGAKFLSKTAIMQYMFNVLLKIHSNQHYALTENLPIPATAVTDEMMTTDVDEESRL